LGRRASACSFASASSCSCCITCPGRWAAQLRDGYSGAPRNRGATVARVQRALRRNRELRRREMAMVAGSAGTKEDHASQPRRAAHVLAIAGPFVLRGSCRRLVRRRFGAARRHHFSPARTQGAGRGALNGTARVSRPAIARPPAVARVACADLGRGRRDSSRRRRSARAPALGIAASCWITGRAQSSGGGDHSSLRPGRKHEAERLAVVRTNRTRRLRVRTGSGRAPDRRASGPQCGLVRI
jgi:hypothetical protein